MEPLNSATNPADVPVLDAYIAAHERRDDRLIRRLLSDDVRLTLPDGKTYRGRDSVAAFLEDAVTDGAPGDYRLLPTTVGGQPAAANYVRQPGEISYAPIAIDVLSIRNGRLTAIDVQSFDAADPSLPHRL